MEVELPRGMRDLGQNELDEINYVRDRFFGSAHLFNFTVMEPSPIEKLQTLETKAGPSISEEIYSMTDKGGRSIGLRFDLTLGLTRYVTRRRDLKLPVKIASFGGVWRYDEPQSGRYRYFHQCDVEVYGSRSLSFDAEVIEFTNMFLRSLGLDVTIEINHRPLVEEFVRNKLKISDSKLIGEIFRIMDKVPKKDTESIIREYGNKFDKSILEELMEFSGIRGNLSEVVDNTQLNKLENWKTIVELLGILRTKQINNTVVNLGIVRGIDYYSGIVFEVFEPTTKFGALAGGGRYDLLTEQFGRKDIGATGAAVGVERIILALRERNLLKRTPDRIVYVASASNSTNTKAIEIVSLLRNNGIATDYDLQVRSLTKQLNDAASRNASIAVIVAPREIETGEVIIKSLKTGKEKKKEIRNLIEELRINNW